MSAIFTSIAGLLKSGDHIIASRALFGSTHQILTQLLPRWGITSTYVDPIDINSWNHALQPNTKMVVLETPSNPGLTIVDLEAAGHFCKQHNLIFNVDNCFATPYLQKPISYGADIVTHSATKFIDGQGRVLGGVIVGKAHLMEEIKFMIRHTGPALSPFNAWMLSKSLETLHVRMDRHCDNAMNFAKYFEHHKDINYVNYPHLKSHPQYDLAAKQMSKGGGIVAFEIKGGVERGKRFLNSLQMCSLSSNLGDARTIVTHPASTTHSKLTEEERAEVGITDGLVRVSVGLEHVDDIIQDISHALEMSK